MAIGNPTHYKVIGSTLNQLPDKRHWDVQEGWKTFKRFAGASDAIIAKANELGVADSGVDEIDEEIEGHSGRLICRVIEDSGGEDGGNTEGLNAVWELIANDLLKPIEAHSYFDAITSQRKRYVEDAARNAEALDAAATAAEKILYTYYSHQMLDYFLTEFVLRKSLIVSKRSEIVLGYTGVNRVVTMESISPPSILLGVLTSLPKGDGTSGAWEWLKKAPQLRLVGKGKYQMDYTWHGAERWSKRFYGDLGSWVPLYE